MTAPIAQQTLLDAADQRRSGAWWNTQQFQAVILIAAVAPLLWPTLPPLVDLPGHLGRYRVMLGDMPELAQYYRFDWQLVGNLGVDLLVRAVAPLLGLEPATKLIVLSIPALTMLGMLRISRAVHGGVTPYALFALPLAFGFPFQFGFVNYTLGMALALNGYASWILWRHHLRRRAALFVAASFAIWLCHVVAWAALCLMIGGYELARARRLHLPWPAAIWRAGVQSLPVAPPVLLLLLWRTANDGGLNAGWGRLDLKTSWLAMVLRDRWMAFDIAVTAVIFTTLYSAARDARTRFKPMIGWSALAMLAAFLLMPATMFGSAYADMRLAPFVVALALLALAPTPAFSLSEQRRLAAGAAALLAVRLTGLTLSYGFDDAAIRREAVALELVPRGARLVSFVGSHCAEPWRMNRLQHISGLAIARRGSFSNDQWPLIGAPLLRVTASGFGANTYDPSQLVLAKPCVADPTRRSIEDALRSLPATRADFLWLLEPPPFDRQLLRGARLVWRSDNGGLYRLTPRQSVPDIRDLVTRLPRERRSR
jgi:hypothetical protein